MAGQKKERKQERRTTPTNDFIRDLEQRIRAGYGAIFVRSFEEDRTLRAIKECCGKIEQDAFVWDCFPTTDSGTTTIRPLGSITGGGNLVEVADVSRLVPTFNSDSFDGRTVLCVLDFNYFLFDQPHTIRSIKNSLNQMKKDGKIVLFIGPQLKIPEELEKDISIIDFPLPSREELMSVLGYVLQSAEEGSPDKKVEISEEIKDKLCEAALGLTSQEAEDLFSLTLARNHKLDGGSVKTVLDGKCEVIKRDGILEYFSPDISVSDVGGLKIVKDWLLKRVNVFTEDARDWGLPYPKGILLVGVQGCGKSLIAKMIANLYGIPLLRLDMGKLFQKFMGESEGTTRKAILVTEAVAPCCLWIDEIEKGFSGTKSSGETDSGVTNRVVQTFLTWMQEKTSSVFIAATGNDVSKLPPELMRKGRIDEIFFVDLPNPDERREIIKIQIAKRPRIIRKPNGEEEKVLRLLENSEIEKIVKASKGYTGSEIEQAVINSLFETYQNKRDLVAEDICKAIEDMVPLAETMKEVIKFLRAWGKGRAKSASFEGKYEAIEEKEDAPTFRRLNAGGE